MTFVNEGGTFVAAREAPEGGNALSYNIYVNGVFVKNTTKRQIHCQRQEHQDS